MLIEQPLTIDHDATVPEDILRFSAKGLSRGKTIDCFDFVPSDTAHVWRVFSALEKGSLCEWGSGMGIATGIAKRLGFQATGIEMNEDLVNASRDLLGEYNLDCPIHHGSYFDLNLDADYYFVYCWPGKMNQVEKHFETSTSPHAKLLICHGAEDIRCKVKANAHVVSA